MSHVWHKYYPAGTKPEIELKADETIGSVLADACRRFSDKTALTCMGADLTYRQLDRLSDQFAWYLQNEAGLKKGDRFAIMLPNVMQFPIAFLAAQKIGAVCVNTNPLYTPREMEHQFKDSGAKAILIVDLFAHNLEKCIDKTDIKHVIVTSIADQLPFLKATIIKTLLKVTGKVPSHNLNHVSFKDAVAKGSGKSPEAVTIKPDDVALLQYTGGTTGLSKGAMLLQSNVLANMKQIQNAAQSVIYEGEETVLTALPLYHIFALSVNFLSFLAMGERMVLVPKPIPIKNVVKIFKKYDITVMTGVNTLFNALNNDDDFQANPPRGLKIALAGGMAVQSATAEQWQKITGRPIVEGFGLTESSPVTHVNPLDDVRTGSIGIPVASTDAKVVDEQGKEVEIGETGELIVKGPQIMAGYWQRDDETAKTIKDGWLWTGDMAKRDEEGFFYIVDRKKDMILVSGFNVFPNEVEDVLAQHPKVLEAAVIGMEDAKSGESVKAFVVAKDKSLTEQELREWSKENLAGYKCPKSYEFKDELPKTNVGKILRRALREGPTSADTSKAG